MDDIRTQLFLLYLNQIQTPDLAAVLSYNGYCDILLYHTRNNTVTKTEPYSIAIEHRSSKLRPKQLKQKLSFVTHSMLLEVCTVAQYSTINVCLAMTIS